MDMVVHLHLIANMDVVLQLVHCIIIYFHHPLSLLRILLLGHQQLAPFSVMYTINRLQDRTHHEMVNGFILLFVPLIRQLI